MSQSLRYPQTVTVKSQTEKVLARIELYKLELKLINLAFPVIEKYQGKPITKHVSNAVQKALGEEYTVSLDNRFGMFHLDIATGGYGKTGPYEKVVHALLGYNSSPFIDIEKVRAHNVCYTLNEERIPKLEAGIKHIPALVEARDKAIKAYQEVFKQAEKYEMDYDFEVGKD